MAGLLKYFQRSQPLPTSEETGLGEVATKEANAAVERILQEERNGTNGVKCKYTHFTPEHRAKIAKYIAECGNTATARHFSREFPTLGESTVRLFKKQYEAELKRKPEQDLPKKKRGRPLTLGELDGKVQQYVRSL